MKNIIVFDSTFYIRNRIKDLTSQLDVHVLEAENTKKMMSLLQNRSKIDLIVMEINIHNEDGIGVLKKIRIDYPDVPIVILTSESKRSSFIRGIQEGASDYILKPFDDDFLINRILKHLNRITVPNKTSEINQEIVKTVRNHKVSFDFQNFLDKELKKASKGGYEVSLLMTLYFKPVKDVNPLVENEYLKVSELLFPELQKVIFETDTFTKYGSQSFIGIFPFCSTENQHLIDEKFQNCFEEFRESNTMIEQYSMFNTFVTFPMDGSSREEIMKELVNRIYKGVDKEKVKYLSKEL